MNSPRCDVPNPEPQTLNPAFPVIGLVCSGGHTAIYHVRNWTDVSLIGSTIDDAVGEAYDKVAAILGLGYPGGPAIDRLADEGDPKAIRFPRSMLGRESLDFSFSGLKTAVLYHVRGVPGKNQVPSPLNEQSLRDVCASFQAACIDTILAKLKRAATQTGANCIIIGGGVSANRGLRAAMKNFPLPVLFPPMQYCTDNAAMSGGLAHVLMEQKAFAALDLDAITYSQFTAS
jgi:N6-L-threonylcarbamoyladenine synthase